MQPRSGYTWRLRLFTQELKYDPIFGVAWVALEFQLYAQLGSDVTHGWMAATMSLDSQKTIGNRVWQVSTANWGLTLHDPNTFVTIEEVLSQSNRCMNRPVAILRLWSAAR
jgi:hypothetical protein